MTRPTSITQTTTTTTMMDSPPEASDVYSLSDHLLAERLQFVKEIGFGNWGSVWLCRPKSPSGKQEDVDVAVKLVHRSKTSTTAARVRSLWNEMKIVRSFKHDPHPSIIPFHSFIITPSYALITMAFLPTLIPVEVSEPRAKKWFKSLLSGVHFLHSRGVVHNDIKPANILLSHTNVPVLVDFGFAEKYDLSSPKAFHSNLTYGTPEYLSPERARGIPHDTRKSDIWSLGVTFFEILIGRTPFEYEEGEVFEKKEDLEKYWNRTMRGKWVGKYTMSQSAERFLKRLIVPNADLRCTAAQAMDDVYWDTPPDVVTYKHKKSVSAGLPVNSHMRTPSFFDSTKVSNKEKESSVSRLLDISLPWSASRSTSRSPASTSRSVYGSESASRSVSRADSVPSSASRLPSSSASASKVQTPDRSAEIPTSLAGTPGRADSSTRTLAQSHSRSKSQPKLRPPSGITSNAYRHGRKLSTVQASPIIKGARWIDSDIESDSVRDTIDATGVEKHECAHPNKLLSFNSISSIRRPLGPRQPSPRAIDTSRDAKSKRHPLSHVTHIQDQTDASVHSHLSGTTGSHVPLAALSRQTPTHMDKEALQTPSHTVRTSQTANSQSKQLSGKPPRNRTRAGVLADLTGFARNVDLTAHGVGRPAKRENRKEKPVKGREPTKKGNKENGPVPQTHGGEKEIRAPFATLSSSNQCVQNGDNSTASIPITANISSATTVTKGSVRDRMMDWERERERLREMERLADMSVDGEGDRGSTVRSRSRTSLGSEEEPEPGVEADAVARDPSGRTSQRIDPDEQNREVKANVGTCRPASSYTTTTAVSSASADKGQIEVAKIGVRASAQILSSRNASVSVLGLNPATERKMSGMGEDQSRRSTDNGLPTEARRTSESALSGLKHSVKASIDKGVRLYKSSTLGQLTGRTTPVWCTSPEPIDFEERRSGEEGRFSWENIKPEQEIAVDRMNLWIQSVERVVEETRLNFASRSVTPPAALPLAPISRSSSQQCSTHNNALPPQNPNTSNNTMRSSRLPRRLLAANEIFAEPTSPDAPLSPGRMDTSCIQDQSTSFSYVTAPDSSVPVLPSISVLMQTPWTPRRRRATISTRSPAQVKSDMADDGVFDTGSPSKRREKSKSQGNLDRHIRDVAKLELELDKDPVSAPSPRLSAVLDRSLFIAPPVSPRCAFPEDATTPVLTRGRSIQFDDLNASPYHVEPYPPRKSGDQAVLSSPDRRRVEGVYDRFLMATSGVKRVGKGYQSDHLKPVHNVPSTSEHAKLSTSQSRTFGVFGPSKRVMPPPVSSEDHWRRSKSIDEFGFVSCSAGANASSTSRVSKDEGKNTATFVRRAFKAMVPGRTVSRRLSRTIAS